MAVQNSNQINVRLDGVLVNNVTNCSLSVSNNLIEVTRGNTNGYVERLSGVSGAVVTIDGYLDTNDLNRYSVGSSVSVIFGTRLQGHTTTVGLIESIDISGGTDNAPTYSITIRISGNVINYVPDIVFETLMTRDGRDIETRAGMPIEGRVIVYN